MGNRICEAGCYQCLLSYFNQPDHEFINRRDEDALKLLVALANSQVTAVSSDDSGQASETKSEKLEDGISSDWFLMLAAKGLSEPDAINVVVGGGQATAVAQYKSSRVLVFIESLSEELSQQLIDKGWQILDFSSIHKWDELFDHYKDVLGVAGS